MRFNQMTEEEKLEHLNNKLKDAHDFLKQIEERKWSAYDSSVNLRIEEFEWVMKIIKEQQKEIKRLETQLESEIIPVSGIKAKTYGTFEME